MIKIVKASAGSGKTYSLARDYISLLKEKYDYRHILAVTFTNKATAEMKERILHELRKDAKSDAKAEQMLTDILHDYSAFSISTIDKFFQRALKSFAREIGQFADYQIELDRDALIVEAMDRILDGLTPDDTEILEWLKSNVNYSLSQGQKVNIEGSLYEMGSRLKSEERLKFPGASEDFSRKRLLKLRKNCDGIIESFTKRVCEAAKDVKVSKAYSLRQIAPYLKGFKHWEQVPYPGGTLAKEADGTPFMDFFTGKEYIWYRTALAIKDMWFSLGLAGEFYREFDAMVKEKNIMCLDDSNTLLAQIIAGSDAPFVYEKMGVRYKHFLLDEFQDTSAIQWQNFSPLLRESNAGGNENLIVGDVKQSIYRWRDSDWSLLGSEVQREFPDSQVDHSRYNWRSLDEIRNFNNGFFEFAAKEVLGADAGIYSDVVQASPTAKCTKGGFVKVSFCEKDKENDTQLAKVIESIKAAEASGAQLGDITILVRNRKEGFTIASALMAEGYRVISDDSLNLKSSNIVRKIVALLSSGENSDDSISRFIVEQEGISFPDQYHSLLELCEHLLRELYAKNPASFNGETLFIEAFMDNLRDWVDHNGNDLHFFLDHFKESDIYIGSPDNSNSIRVLTIHKAKGLQAPYIIFPYADKVGMFKKSWHWCELKVEGTPFDPEVAGIYPVLLTKSDSPSTLFADAYEEEARKQKIDNINVFYVALTRAAKCMHIIAAEPSKKFKASLAAGAPDYSSFADVLYAYCALGSSAAESGFEREYGQMYDFVNRPDEAENKKPDEDKKPDIQDFLCEYSSYDISDRLKNVSDAAAFFEGIMRPEIESPRHNGIVLHSILSKVDAPEDLQAAVEQAVLDGYLSEKEGKNAYQLLSNRIARHPDFFQGDGTALNESSIISADGEFFRPDRVIIAPDGSVSVIDYKFGKEKDEYIQQVRGYIDLYTQMGYRKVKGLLWYVYQDKLVTL